MIVVKFGGTSLAGTERMRAAARIVAALGRDSSVVCVVSAMAGVTDTLLQITEQVTTGAITGTITGITTSATTTTPLTGLRTRHQHTLTALTTTASIPEITSITTRFETLWSALEADLEHLRALGDEPADVRSHAVAAFSGWGERLAVLLFSAALAAEGVAASVYEGEPIILAPRAASGVESAAAASARPWDRLAPSVAATREAVAPWIHAQLDADRVPVLPGYLGRTQYGLVTILGRNGSDYSAAVLAAALSARSLTIYSDVAGLHRADPRVVYEAELLPALTYADAAEIAALGARVLHPDTMRPLAAAGIPLHLRSAFTPDAPGTRVGGADFVRDHVHGRESWVVAARPLLAEQPLFGSPAEWAPGLVEVAGVFLAHADLPAREDDHLSLPSPAPSH
ncbi:MAG TPA: aspartate kinase, partial [Ktedonobacterales bacterium]|nr:aspartate kinase [Ktedonobacterales bacterium]